jgi:hypothetical protein
VKKLIVFLILGFSTATAQADKLLIYMDGKQTEHLKAYGVAYWVLGRGQNVEWF